MLQKKKPKMETNRITISEASPVDKLNGKVVDKMIITKPCDTCGSMMVMTFMDGTYFAITVSTDSLSGNCGFKNMQLMSPVAYLKGKIIFDGECVHVDDSVRKMQEVGVIGLTDEHVQNETERVVVDAEMKLMEEYNSFRYKYANGYLGTTLAVKLWNMSKDGRIPKDIIQRVKGAMLKTEDRCWDVFEGAYGNLIIQLKSMRTLLLVIVSENSVSYILDKGDDARRRTYKGKFNGRDEDSLSVLLNNLKDSQFPMWFG